MSETAGHGLYSTFRDSILGEAIHYLSGRKLLVPPTLSPEYCIDSKYKPIDEKTTFYPSTPANSLNAQDKDSRKASPSTSRDGSETEYILVTWDGENDPENPRNWSSLKKGIIAVLITFLTTAAYMASAVFTPAESQMLGYFGTTQVKLMLGLTMFVWGYAIGPLFISAMSESPSFGGRRYIFIVSQFLFVIFQIPTALATDLASFVVLRFLAGVVTAPPLSVGPASLGDMYDFPSIAYVISYWSLGTVCGPYVGPLIGAALSHANSWRWIFWFLLMQGGLALVLFAAFFPETSEQALLMRKAKRLRHLTGNPNIKAPGDLLKANTSFKSEIKTILWLPFEMCLREPVLDLVNLHLTLLYSVMYLFFEAFPIVFMDTFDFTLVEEGVAFVGLMTGIFAGVVMYLWYLNRYLIKPILEGTPKTPEFVFGGAALFASINIPIGLFIFGWSATPSAHWMGPIMGGFFFSIGTFILFQSYIAYIGKLYPRRVASALASCTFLRSMTAGAFPLFGTVFFNHTGTKNYPVGWGSSIIGFVGVAMIGLPLYLVKYGTQLRERTLKKYGVIQ